MEKDVLKRRIDETKQKVGECRNIITRFQADTEVSRVLGRGKLSSLTTALDYVEDNLIQAATIVDLKWQQD